MPVLPTNRLQICDGRGAGFPYCRTDCDCILAINTTDTAMSWLSVRSLKDMPAGLRWRTRITLWLAAGAAGLFIVAFAKLTDIAQEQFRHWHAGYAWLPFVLTPAMGMLIVWATKTWLPGTQGSGIPQVIAAARLASRSETTSRLVSLRIAFGKIWMVVLGLLGGFSIGREGPSVQVAASVVHSAYRYLPHHFVRDISQADLILAGGAAGVAAAFNTPLAGIMFAIEELGRRHEEAKVTGILLITVILSGLVAIGFQGNYTYFGHLDVGNVARSIVLPVLVCGLSCGLFGGIFSRLLLMPHQYPQCKLWRFRTARPVLFAGLCGLIVAMIGWLSGGYSFGSGYAMTASAITGHITLDWQAPFAKFAATAVSYFSGIPGGIFAPALAIGAAVGFDVAPWVDGFANQHQVVALCMAAFLAAVTQAPITAAIIVMEMVDGHGMVLSLMAVALIAKVVSSSLGPELYQQLALGFVMHNETPSRDGHKVDCARSACQPRTGLKVHTPSAVIIREPNRCAEAATSAHIGWPRAMRVKTSAEKLEMVVRPPRKPVMANRRHSGGKPGCWAKKAMATPTR